MILNILGTKYKVIKRTKSQDGALGSADGYCDPTTKEIVMDKDITKPKENAVRDLKSYENTVMRHEAIHAFFYESGLEEYYRDEVLVEWIALQLPKMVEVLKDYI